MTATARCILCDSAGPFAPVFEDGPYRLVRCVNCGLVLQRPQPSDEVLAASYYHDEGFAESLAGPLREIALGRARAKAPLLEAVGALRPGTRALDVGCSSGAWLEVAGSNGIEAVGVEVGEATAEAARRRGLDVRTGTLEEALSGLRGERFELITFWDVLEHLRDPRRELALVRELLTEDGILAATCPNVLGWYPRATYRLLARTTGVWEYPELPLHLYDFAPPTARRLLERTGYRPVAVRTIPTPFQFYRETSLALSRVGHDRRGRLVRAAFEVLRATVYPAARLFDRQNSMFVAARPLAG